MYNSSIGNSKFLNKFTTCKEIISIKHFILFYTTDHSVYHIIKLRETCRIYGLTLGLFTAKHFSFLEKLCICSSSQLKNLRGKLSSNIYVVRGKGCSLFSFIKCYSKLIEIFSVRDYDYVLGFGVNRSLLNLYSCSELLVKSLSYVVTTKLIYKLCLFCSCFFVIILELIFKIIFYSINCYADTKSVITRC